MYGQKTVLSGFTFSDMSLPVIRDDAILNAGSLFLFDPSHSQGGFTGVPATGDTVPNVAWKEAAALIGAGTEASLKARVTSSGNVANEFKLERTAKGGLHGIISQVAQTAGRSFSLAVAAAIRDYVYANRVEHSFYFSMWHRVTRLSTASSVMQSTFHYIGATAATSLFYAPNSAIYTDNGAAKIGARTTAQDTQGVAGSERFANGGIHGITSTGPLPGNDIQLMIGTGSVWNSFNVNKGASRVLYRVYIEDLTVSGRTYAEADAQDYALYQAAFGVGGRFNGDTYTAPSTLP